MSGALVRASSTDDRRFSRVKQLIDVAAGVSPRQSRSPTPPDTLADRMRRASPVRGRSKSPRRGATYTLIEYCQTSALLAAVTRKRLFLVPNTALDEAKYGILAQAQQAPAVIDELRDDATVRRLVADAIYLLDSQSRVHREYVSDKVSGTRCGALEEYQIATDTMNFDETPVTRVYRIAHPT